ncbi:HD domain-containing protein [Ihubacter massiliensis]|uniref:HD domain-containing protein n=1 Tax=Hominibacterium faecale TaxID=2839743 RepID=A0A9J6QU98_9FIRM|nr:MULTISPECIES: HD domain-containing protein [Eubacteriales Family XIII. Incertae Sedis]MCI7300716.1 HD domain-containing protein [Clostridia bacterium]MCO7123314.1 HD domain-containing protein [Ihubacter massiliensis]MCU7379797.1 HD domain-containing protein [Hominibacterium faecale]MDY3011904.1 HD domain-containing protein [Clostridiales Family XIII bacterium]
MKEVYIANIKTAQEVTDFFMVKSIAVKIGANKKQYLDLMLADKTGEISGKKWDVADEELPSLAQIKEGDIVKIRANVTEWNGLKQFRVLRIRRRAENDPLEFSDFIKAAPERPEDMYEYILGKAEAFSDQDLKKLCVKVLQENREKLMYYPAAQKNHHAEMAGLLYHVKRMLMNGERMCQVYTNLNADLVMAGVILHDMEKLNEIESNELGISSGYSFEGQMLGHLIQGIKVLDRLTEELDFPKEKAIMLEHMILSHHYEPEFGSPKKPLFPEAEILHYLDMIDARMFDMQDALDKTEPGEFSDRVWTLDNRRLYKVKD